MNSCDTIWYKNVSDTTFKNTNGIYNIRGEKILSPDQIADNSTISLANSTNLNFNFEINLNALWVLDNCSIKGNIKVKDTLRTKSNFKLYGNIYTKSAYFGHNYEQNGNIIVEEELEIGNNASINGNIDAKIIKIGEKANIKGYIKADKIYAGSQCNIEGNVICNEFMTGENSKLLGNNQIGYLYSQNGLTINGGIFNELHTDDNFLSTSSIQGTKLIMDNCATIKGSVQAKEYIRVGDNSIIEGDLNCNDYLEYGPGTKFMGNKFCLRERQLPPSSAKIRKNGKVYFEGW